ncbi:hypothetical protein T190_07505 [Sinorhizobium meliloti CCBAU 01290]|nr:hypothetical protein T190_07505 [Sinorhizobium meliloti CCBAU 01290]
MIRDEEQHGSATAQASGQLCVYAAGAAGRIYLSIDQAGVVRAFNGHVDLGTGIRTSLAQIVAEELDVPFNHVEMILGDTRTGPDQGATIASETIQVTAIPLRQASATARAYLLDKAAAHLDAPRDRIILDEGVIRGSEGENWNIPIGD